MQITEVLKKKTMLSIISETMFWHLDLPLEYYLVSVSESSSFLDMMVIDILSVTYVTGTYVTMSKKHQMYSSHVSTWLEIL